MGYFWNHKSGNCVFVYIKRRNDNFSNTFQYDQDNLFYNHEINKGITNQYRLLVQKEGDVEIEVMEDLGLDKNNSIQYEEQDVWWLRWVVRFVDDEK